MGVPYLPPAVIGLLLAMAVFSAVVLMFGLRLRMRRDLEPLSARARLFLAASIALIIGAGYVIVRLFETMLDT